MAFNFERVGGKSPRLPDAYAATPDRGLLRRLMGDLLHDELPATLPSRAQWLEATRAHWLADRWDAPACYLTVLGNWMLARVRMDPQLAEPETRRAARLWSCFSDPRTGPALPRDVPDRGLPGPDDRPPGSAPRDPVELISEIERRREASYWVSLPVVDWDDRAFVIKSRVSVLAAPDGPATGDDRLLLAPWSHFLVHPENVRGVVDALAACDDIVHDRRLLLEFLELDKAAPPNLVLVEGNSLDLAVILAALAAKRQPGLLPIVVTGRINGRERTIEKVTKLKEKLCCAEDYARDSGQHILFVVPGGNESRLPSPDGLITIVPAPSKVGELPAWLDQHLIDGCDRYRELLGAEVEIVAALNERAGAADWPETFEESDLESLRRFAREARHARLPASGPLSAEVLPFGNDPRVAARRVAREVISRDRSPDDVVVPLLLPLKPSRAARPEDPGTLVANLLWHLRQGMLDVHLTRPSGSTEEKLSLIAEGDLRNLLVGFSERLLFLIYVAPSLDLDDDAGGGDRLGVVLAEIRQHAPKARAVVIASDRHHYDWLEMTGMLSPATAINAPDS